MENIENQEETRTKDITESNHSSSSKQFKDSILKNLKESSPKTIKEVDKNVFVDDFVPETDDEKIHESQSLNLNLEISEQNKIIKQKDTNLILNTKESLHLNIIIKKNISYELALNFENPDFNSLILNLILEENSFFKLTVFSKNKALTRYFADCKKDSRLEISNFLLSGADSKSRISLEEDASCVLATSYLSKETRSSLKDIVVHQGKNSKSLITAKGYLINGFSDFRGLIKINPGAYYSEGFQDSQVLLEENSKAISVPDLEIANNEVKCSHGSTVSRIRDEDLFYFESRGINKEDAKKMLVRGFLLSLIPDREDLKIHAEKLLSEVYS